VFDWLKGRKSGLIEKNPAGFLRMSIEENYHPPELEFRVCRQITGVLRSRDAVMTRVYSLHYGDSAQNL
jgi:hypothetical protein